MLTWLHASGHKPKAGLKVLDHIRFNPDTTDFTPIFYQIEDAHPAGREEASKGDVLQCRHANVENGENQIAATDSGFPLETLLLFGRAYFHHIHIGGGLAHRADGRRLRISYVGYLSPRRK